MGVKQLRVIYRRVDGTSGTTYSSAGEFTIPLEYSALPNKYGSNDYGYWHVGGVTSPTIRDSNRLTCVLASVWYPTGGSLENCNFTFNGAWTLYGTAATNVTNLCITAIYACY